MDEVHYLIIVRVNERELAKSNRKAARAGCAPRTADDVVEAALSDALKHNHITADNYVVKKIK
jgi:hypothetical protein